MTRSATPSQSSAQTSPLVILGASSLIGRFLVSDMEAAGIAAVALSRAPRAASAGGSVRWLAANLQAPELEAVLSQVDTVINLAPIWLAPAALPALTARGMRRFVAFSSTSVFTKAGSDHPDEQAMVQRLRDGEAAVRAFCEAHGVAWTILRPTLIYAEGQDGNVSRLAKLIRRMRVLPLAGAGRGLRQPVHAQDLAHAALAAARSPAAHDRVYDLPGGETLTYRQMVERIFIGLGRRPRIIAAPQVLWRLAFRLARPLLPGATAQMGARMSADLVFNDDAARRDFGWSPRDFRPKFDPN